MEGKIRMAPLTWVNGAFRAQVLAARLESEGIEPQLRGAGNPYGLTVGDLARVDVYVPEDQLDDATYVLLADEVDATLAAPDSWTHADPDGTSLRPRWLWWGALALLVVCVVGVASSSLRHW